MSTVIIKPYDMWMWLAYRLVYTALHFKQF